MLQRNKNYCPPNECYNIPFCSQEFVLNSDVVRTRSPDNEENSEQIIYIAYDTDDKNVHILDQDLVREHS